MFTIVCYNESINKESLHIKGKEWESHMNKMADTIIEIYDEEPIYNILSAAVHKPTRVVYIGGERLKSRRVRKSIATTFMHLGVKTECLFRTCDMSELSSVLAQLTAILEQFGDCAVDITGGNETALVACGMLAKERELPLFKYDRNSSSYRSIYNCTAAETEDELPSFNVEAVLSMAGGAMKSHGHLSLEEIDKETEDDIFKVWSIYKSHYRAWHKSVAYLQQVSKHLDGGSLAVSGASVIYGGERISGADRAVMEALADAGIIRNYKNEGRRISFCYKSKLMQSCLCDAGICLELYVFAAAKRMGIFSDVSISTVIDWDGDLDARYNTINEIDVFCVSGFVPLFISCKSGAPNVTALNEIKTLASRFGGEYARPVLVTMSDVRTRDRYLARRAEDMGVALIDRSDLVSEQLPKRLFKIAKM